MKIYPFVLGTVLMAGCYRVPQSPQEPVGAAPVAAPVPAPVPAPVAATPPPPAGPPVVVSAPIVEEELPPPPPKAKPKKKLQKKKKPAPAAEAPAAACDIDTIKKVREEGRQEGLKEAKDAMAKDAAVDASAKK